MADTLFPKWPDMIPTSKFYAGKKRAKTSQGGWRFCVERWPSHNTPFYHSCVFVKFFIPTGQGQEKYGKKNPPPLEALPSCSIVTANTQRWTSPVEYSTKASLILLPKYHQNKSGCSDQSCTKQGYWQTN